MEDKNIIIDFINLKKLDKNYYSLNRINTKDSIYDSFKIKFEKKAKKLKSSFLKTIIINYLDKNIGFNNSNLKKIKHYNKMYSLQKVYSIEAPLLINLVNNAIKYGFSIIVEPKVDGIAVELYNDILVSRGDGIYGNNISRSLKYISNIPDTNKNEVIYGELYLIKEKGRIDNNHRNIVTGLINSKHKINEEYSLGLFQFVDHFNKINEFTEYKIQPNDLKNTLHKIEENINNIFNNKNNYNYYIDGVVIKLIQNDSKKLPKTILGYTDKYPKFSIAYKFEAEKSHTFLRDVIWDIGKTGKLTVVGILDPILIQGSKIQKVTLHNPDFISSKGLKIGSKVEISRIGDVIPAITKVYPNAESCIDIETPDKCPVCQCILSNYLCKNEKCKGVISKQWESKYKLTIKQSYDIISLDLNVFNFKDNLHLAENNGWSKNKIESILKKLTNIGD